MTRYCLFCVLLANTLDLISQDIGTRADALIEQVYGYSNHPVEQVDSLNSIATKYLQSDPNLTVKLSQHAIQIANQAKYKKGEAISRYFIGTCLAYKELDVALEHLLISHRLAIETDSLALQADALLSMAIVQGGMDLFDKAIATIQKAKEIAESTEDLKRLSRVHTNLATLYYNQDEIVMALEHSRKALELKLRINDEYGTRLNYLNLGVILCEYDSTLDEGIAYLKKSRRLSKGDPIMVNDIMANMIWAYSVKSNYDLCLSYLDSALMGSDSIDNPYTKQAIHRLGKEIHLEIKDYEQAYIHAAEEFELYKELKGKEVEGRFKVLELENENHEKQKQIILLEKKRSEADLKFFYAVILASLFLLLLVFVHKNYRLKKKRLEDFKIQQREIEEKSYQLELKNKETEQFAYVASHDLKAPLNTIISCINLLNDEIDQKLEGKSQQMASFIASSANRMKSMIDSLLEHGRLGKDISFVEVNLNLLLNDLQQDLNQLISETGAVINVSYLPKVNGSTTELYLLFQNLITNAIKFSSADQVPNVTITYKSLKRANRYQFSIRDNGVGIPQNRQDKIFTIFERAHGKQFEGSGIGLAHCMKIIKLHKGSIWVESVEGEGTCFHFVLPMKNLNADSLLIEGSEKSGGQASIQIL